MYIQDVWTLEWNKGAQIWRLLFICVIKQRLSTGATVSSRKLFGSVWSSQLGKGCNWHLVDSDYRCCKYPAVHRTWAYQFLVVPLLLAFLGPQPADSPCRCWDLSASLVTWANSLYYSFFVSDSISPVGSVYLDNSDEHIQWWVSTMCITPDLVLCIMQSRHCQLL